MNMPGFTAQVALYDAIGHYRLRRSFLKLMRPYIPRCPSIGTGRLLRILGRGRAARPPVLLAATAVGRLSEGRSVFVPSDWTMPQGSVICFLLGEWRSRCSQRS